MTKYATRPRSYWVDEHEAVHEAVGTPTVHDHEPIDTGILDARGDPIMRLPNPIGFGRSDEW